VLFVLATDRLSRRRGPYREESIIYIYFLKYAYWKARIGAYHAEVRHPRQQMEGTFSLIGTFRFVTALRLVMGK